MITLPKITSIATTLGAKTVSAKTFELSQVHPVVPHVVEDAEAVSACHQFLSKCSRSAMITPLEIFHLHICLHLYFFTGDHRFLVEPSCGAALAAAYTPGLFAKTFPHLKKNSNIVMIVCGGSNINFEILEQFKNQFGVGSH